MTDEILAIELPLHLRLRFWASHPATWIEVGKFLAVGAVGYAVNLAVYGACVQLPGVEYRVAAALAFVCALATTFALNRRFTFGAHDGPLAGQAWRYLLVNLAGFAANIGVLQLLVERAATPKLPAEAIAAVLAAPVNYAGQRLWAFARRSA